MTDDRRDLAAEYAIGLLTGDEFRRAQALAASDREFAAEVSRWSGHFAPLLDDIEPIPAPGGAWTAIEQQIERSAASANVVQLHRRLVRWRAAAGAMTAIAASLGLFILVRPVQSPVPVPVPAESPVPATLVAALGNAQGGTKVVASWNPAAKQLVLVISGDLPADPRRSHELWVIPPGGKPRSLGLLSEDKQMHLELANALATLLQQGATIAVSIEPRGGSPTGAPTGPVVASGALTRA